MQSVTKILTAVVSEAFGKCGYDEKLGVVTPSDRLYASVSASLR